MFMVMFMARKTTIILRDDVYEALKARGGPRNMSKLINEILVAYFASGRSMFGTMKQTDISDLRNHRDRV